MVSASLPALAKLVMESEPRKSFTGAQLVPPLAERQMPPPSEPARMSLPVAEVKRMWLMRPADCV
jgi:hypothetical protein